MSTQPVELTELECSLIAWLLRNERTSTERRILTDEIPDDTLLILQWGLSVTKSALEKITDAQLLLEHAMEGETT